MSKLTLPTLMRVSATTPALRVKTHTDVQPVRY
jgi:hypothetical protein